MLGTPDGFALTWVDTVVVGLVSPSPLQARVGGGCQYVSRNREALTKGGVENAVCPGSRKLEDTPSARPKTRPQVLHLLRACLQTRGKVVENRKGVVKGTVVIM